jgi:hypothetical protein
MAELFTKMDSIALRQEFQTAMDTLGLRLTVRLGAMLAAAVALLAAIQKLS